MAEWYFPMALFYRDGYWFGLFWSRRDTDRCQPVPCGRSHERFAGVFGDVDRLSTTARIVRRTLLRCITWGIRFRLFSLCSAPGSQQDGEGIKTEPPEAAAATGPSCPSPVPASACSRIVLPIFEFPELQETDRELVAFFLEPVTAVFSSMKIGHVEDQVRLFFSGDCLLMWIYFDSVCFFFFSWS